MVLGKSSPFEITSILISESALYFEQSDILGNITGELEMGKGSKWNLNSAGNNTFQLDLMFMKHYAPNRCLYIKVAKLRTGVGSAETSYLQNCSVKIFKEHFSPNLQREIIRKK